jgi:hypothetical protein
VGTMAYLAPPSYHTVSIMEESKTTSHQAWTHQPTDNARQLLGPFCSFRLHCLQSVRGTACCQVHYQFVVQGPRQECGYSGPGDRCCPPPALTVVTSPVGQGGLLEPGCQWRQGGWCTPTVSFSFTLNEIPCLVAY